MDNRNVWVQHAPVAAARDADGDDDGKMRMTIYFGYIIVTNNSLKTNGLKQRIKWRCMLNRLIN